jgi:hypothetical protein
MFITGQATMKRKLKDLREKSIFHTGTAANWKKFRYTRLNDGPKCTIDQDKTKIYADSVHDFFGDYVGDSSELISRLRHTGWYGDNMQHSLIKGGVCRLRTSKGVLYIPLVRSDQYEGVTLFLNQAVRVSTSMDHDEAKQQAARIADRCAEREAEESREYDAKDRAAQRIEELKESIHEINKKALALMAEIKKAGTFSPNICEALTGTLRTMLRTKTLAYNEIKGLNNNFWLAVE